MNGYPTVFEGIIFIETLFSECKDIFSIKCDLSFKLGSQLKSLNDVKKSLADQARQNQCALVHSFQYGQKSRWLAIDDVAYFGSGICSQISEEKYKEITEYIKNRDGK